MLHLNKVHHIAIICSDYQRSLYFYTHVLGLKVLAEHFREARQSFKTDLALGEDYAIELVAQAAEELDALGISHEDVRTDEYTGKRFFFFQDPDGLPIEVYEK